MIGPGAVMFGLRPMAHLLPKRDTVLGEKSCSVRRSTLILYNFLPSLLQDAEAVKRLHVQDGV